MPDQSTNERIAQHIASHDVVLFMKGNRGQPQCGFSATVIGILEDLTPDYETFDVLQDPELRNGIKEFSSWPTIPQLYVKGEFVGGCDIIQELYGSGELYETLGVPLPEAVVPKIELTDRAAAYVRDALERAPGQVLHFRVGRNFEPRLYLGPKEVGEIEAEAGGLIWHVDRPTGPRANGVRIDYAETAHGHELRIDNPNAPPAVKEISVTDLKALLDAGPIHLIDVRSPEECATARIEGARRLDDAVIAEIEAMPKDTPLIFYCHHGSRSLKAAEHFLALGFGNVHNVVGGIDAWSRQIDQTIARY